MTAPTCTAECNPGNCRTAHAMHFDGSLDPAPCSRQAQPTRAERAMHALRNAMTRAKAKDNAEAKERTLLAGMVTAQSWLDGTHTLIHNGTVSDPPSLLVYAYCAKCGDHKDPNRNYVDGCGVAGRTFAYCAKCGDAKVPSNCYVHDECLAK